MSRRALARSYASACGAIMLRDLQVAATYRLTFFGQLLGAFLSLAMFYYISRLVRVESFPSPGAYFAFVIVGMMILQILQSAFGTPGRVRGELMAGTFERVILSPVGAIGGILGLTLFPLTFALVISAIMLVYGSLVFDLHVEWSTVALAAPVALLGTAAFGTFGLLFTASTLVFKQTAAGMAWITLGITVLAGVYFPITLLPGWIQWTADVQPFTPAMDLLRHLISGTPLRGTELGAVAKLCGFIVLLAPVAIVALRGALTFTRRRGTIIEY